MSSHHDIIAKFTKTLEEWDYKLDRLEHRFEDLPEELKVTAEKKYQKLLAVRDVLQEKEETLKRSSEQAIDEIEKSLEDFIDSFKLLFEDIEVDIEVEGT